MKTGNKRGFTLVELLLVAVIGAVLVSATYQILLSSQRAMTVQTAQLIGQQAVRAGIDVLSSELRELSRAEGDILTMGSDRIEIRAMRAFGLVCNVTGGGTPIRVKKVGRYFENGDSIMVLAENDPDFTSDDTIVSGVVSSINTGQTCTGTDTAQMLAVPALAQAFANGDTVRLGAPVRAFTTYTYGLYTVDGEPYLARNDADGTSPLVGPLSSDGVSFVYLDAFGSVTTTPTAVSRIEVTLRSASNVVDQNGAPISDSLSTTIYLRN